MGLDKDMTLDNGVELKYHRISRLIHEVNVATVIEVVSYTSQGKRDEEAESASTGAPEAMAVECSVHRLEYSPEMNIPGAYEWLKLNGYEGASDVIDNWAAGLSYYTDDTCMYQETEYRCIQAHTSQAGWEPPNVPALWAKEQDPHDIPEWVQPTGAHDAYALGDKVRHNGKVWESDYDSNIWEPGVYGWREV